MPETIEILVEREADVPAQSHSVSPEITIIELIRILVPDRPDDFVIVVEEEDAPRGPHHRLHECNIRHHTRVHCHPKVIHYTVDNEHQETRHHKLTAKQILENAKFDPKTYYLIRLIGKHHQESYKDKPDATIHMHNCMRFTVGSSGPTPVS